MSVLDLVKLGGYIGDFSASVEMTGVGYSGVCCEGAVGTLSAVGATEISRRIILHLICGYSYSLCYRTLSNLAVRLRTEMTGSGLFGCFL